MAQGVIKLIDSESVAPLGGAEGLIGQSMLQLIVQRGATPPVAVIAGGKSYVLWCIFPCQGPFLSWGWLVCLFGIQVIYNTCCEQRLRQVMTAGYDIFTSDLPCLVALVGFGPC